MLRYFISGLLVSGFFACQQQKAFKFALFSDTHIGGTPSAAVDLRNAVADVNKQPDIDFVIISGDITDMNTDNHLELAKQILDSLNVPYYIIPGNHDTKWSGSAGANFRALWGDDKFVFDHAGYRFIGFHQGPILRMDDGHIPREVLTWLEAELRRTGTSRPVALVMHYPLNDAVDNWYECVDIIKDYNIKFILHGHGHRNRFQYYQGIPAFMGRSTLRARESAGGYTIFTMRNDSLIASERTPGGPTGKPWGAASLDLTPPVAAVADSLMPDYSVNKKYLNVHSEWIFNSGYTMTASPVCDDRFAYVGDVSGTVYALALSDGSVSWKFDGAGSVYGTACIDNDHLVFTSSDSTITCLKKSTGSLLWRVPTNNAMVSVPVVRDDIVYTGSSDGVFRALDMRHGETIWQYDSVGSYVETRPLLYQGKVIFGAWDGKLYALDQSNGSLIWKWHGERTNPLYSPAACWPVGAENKIFIAAPDRYMTAVDARNGATVWRDNDWKFRETVGLSTDSALVFARSMTDSVIAFETRRSLPAPGWAKDFDYGYDIAPSMPQEKEGTLYWGTKNGMIFAAVAADGSLKWKYKYQNYLIETVVPQDSERVLFSNIDGDVVLLSGRSGSVHQ
jgi:outer membrane protein assembly factor BamB/predicted phosphodiesterase